MKTLKAKDNINIYSNWYQMQSTVGQLTFLIDFKLIYSLPYISDFLHNATDDNGYIFNAYYTKIYSMKNNYILASSKG